MGLVIEENLSHVIFFNQNCVIGMAGLREWSTVLNHKNALSPLQITWVSGTHVTSVAYKCVGFSQYHPLKMMHRMCQCVPSHQRFFNLSDLDNNCCSYVWYQADFT
jgi:hypothetical protein